MAQIQFLSSLDAPELAPYRNMRAQPDTRAEGIFVAEGEKVVRRLLESRLEVVSLMLPEKWLGRYSELIASRPEDEILVYTAEKSELEKFTGFTMYQGVLGVGRVPAPVSLTELISGAPKPPLIVALDGLSSAENLGSLARNCAAFGVHGLLIGETCCSPYLRRSVRSSMGTIFKLPVVQSENLARSLAEAKAAGLHIVAAHPHTEEALLPGADFTRGCVVVLGSEGLGISPAVLAACDEAVAVPMHNEVDSLNVATAGAVFLYEAYRQRNAISAGG